MKKGMKATGLRSALTVFLVLLILVIGGGFYLGLQQVRSYAVEVSHTIADSEASANIVTQFQQLKQALTESETLVDKANRLFSTDATYQSQALKDVQKYASDIGLTISNTNFEVAQDAAVGGVGKGHSFEITVQSPVAFSKLLRFLDAIEGNLPKMQIAGITVSRIVTGGTDVTVEGVTIEISTR